MTKEEIETKLEDMRIRWKAGNTAERHWLGLYAKLLKKELEKTAVKDENQLEIDN